MYRAVEPSCAATRLVSVAELETWGSRAASSFIKPVRVPDVINVISIHFVVHRFTLLQGNITGSNIAVASRNPLSQIVKNLEI